MLTKSLLKVSAFILFIAFSANANAVCLDYWLKGPSACKDEPEQKFVLDINSANINVEKDEKRIAYEKDLNIKIDKFLENYGKPPREFVAFNLDPTLENAVRWVKKFNNDYERSRRIAVSWKQADALFKEYKKTGKLTLPANSGVTKDQVDYLLKALEEDPSDLPKVKGFGVDLKGDWDTNVLSQDYVKLDYKDKAYLQATQKLAQSGEGSKFNLDSLMGKTKDESSKTVNGSGKLEISYYFSAKCPFCEKFKPELEDAIKKYGKENIDLTCVDMTPGERKPENIKGKLDCKWRPILGAEARQFGIKRTPSLLVKRDGQKELELLENYHESDVLVKYFRNGIQK